MSVNESAVVVSSSSSHQEDLEWGDEPKQNDSSKKSKSKAKKNKKQAASATTAAAQVHTKESALPEEPAPESTAAAVTAVSTNSSSVSSSSTRGVEDTSDAVTELPPPASLPHLTDITVQAATSSSSASSTSAFASPPPSSSAPSTASYDRRRVMPLESLPISKTPMFLAFRSSVQKQRCVVGNAVWVYFDLGPKDIAPLICICGTSGTAEMFFYQVMELGNKGFRVISVSPPAYYSHDDWVNGFNGFLAAMGFVDQSKKHVSAAATPAAAAAAALEESKKGGNYVGKVHVFANSLAGYMCLYYLSHIIPSRNHIASLILCNSFIDTLHYQKQNGNSNWCITLLKKAPAFIVRKYVLDSMPETTLYPESVDFMIEQFEDNLPNDVLASRLILNILRNRGVTDVNAWKTSEGDTFPQSNITIMDTSDEGVIPAAMRERLYEALPNARYATLKLGGDLPFLSCPDEVNMHLQVHLRQFGIFPSRNVSVTKAEGEDEIPPAVVLNSLPADMHLTHRTVSKPASGAPSVSSSPNTSALGGTVFLTPGFSLPEKKPRNAQKLGYGNEDEDEENDSIFLTSKPTRKNSSSVVVGGSSGVSDSTLAMARPDGRKQEDPELSERSAIIAQIQAEASANANNNRNNREHDGGHSAAFIAQREQERSERQAASAREIEKIQAEQLKQQKQEEALNSLLDEAAIEDEQRLTKKKPIKKFDSEDLF